MQRGESSSCIYSVLCKYQPLVTPLNTECYRHMYISQTLAFVHWKDFKGFFWCMVCVCVRKRVCVYVCVCAANLCTWVSVEHPCRDHRTTSMCAFSQETTSSLPRQDLSLALNLASKLGCLVSEPTWLHLPAPGF